MIHCIIHRLRMKLKYLIYKVWESIFIGCFVLLLCCYNRDKVVFFKKKKPEFGFSGFDCYIPAF